MVAGWRDVKKTQIEFQSKNERNLVWSQEWE